MSKVMSTIISSSQSAFVKGRNLVDGVSVINEVVDFARMANREYLILKVDFQKAYDTVDWSFLEYMFRRVGFCSKWINWMKACVFGGNMSILVNGSPTEEICIERGLKQGDPLAPFLFLLVAEGFSGLMRNAVNSNSFKGFDLRNNGLVLSHLQYANDTICIGEASVDNLWTLKALLRGFEMTSGLKFNFAKSCLIEVNVGREFMEAACNFMHCREGSLPFKYLGLPVGVNPRRLSTWEPLLDCLNKRLNSWANKYVSLGGRVVLLNAVLNAIPMFYLSFFKLPMKVWKKVVRIQRQFLWGGAKGGNKVCWVKWSTVCLPRASGGLDVRDIRLVNLSLLVKWRWRLVQLEQSLWKEVLICKYGNHIVYPLYPEDNAWPSFASSCWLDLMSLETVVGENWINREVVRKVGNRENTRFWLDQWVGIEPLYLIFPRLFSISSQKDAMVGEVWVDGVGGGDWHLMWRRNLFVWEEGLILNLLKLIDGWEKVDEVDSWWWKLEEEGRFFVSSS